MNKQPNSTNQASPTQGSGAGSPTLKDNAWKWLAAANAQKAAQAAWSVAIRIGQNTKQLTSSPWITAIFTVVIAGATIWNVIVVDRSLGIMQGQLNEMQNTRNDTARFFQTDERAWVELTTPTLKEMTQTIFGPAPDYKFFLKNTGKTAAHDVVAHIIGFKAPANYGQNKEGIENLQYKLDNGDTIEVPGEFYCPITTDSVRRVLAPGNDNIVDLQVPNSSNRSEESVIQDANYIVGKLRYTDVFRTNHWISFCFSDHGGSDTVRQCQEGNDEDRNWGTEGG